MEFETHLGRYLKHKTFANYQNLPHKWWKKGKYYEPSLNYIPVIFDTVFIAEEVVPKSLILMKANIDILYDMEVIGNKKVTPTKYDYIYAINAELWELKLALEDLSTGSNPQKMKAINYELADLAIFCYLYLTKYEYLSITTLIDNLFVEFGDELLVTAEGNLKPITIESTERDIHLLLLYGLMSNNLDEKLDYNRKRSDHDKNKYY